MDFQIYIRDPNYLAAEMTFTPGKPEPKKVICQSSSLGANQGLIQSTGALWQHLLESPITTLSEKLPDSQISLST